MKARLAGVFDTWVALAGTMIPPTRRGPHAGAALVILLVSNWLTFASVFSVTSCRQLAIRWAVVLSLWHLMTHLASYSPNFFSGRVQFVRGLVEVALLLSAIQTLDAWSSPLWLLLTLPILHNARCGSATSTGILVLLAAICPLVALLASHGSPGLLLLQWIPRSGFLCVFGLLLSVALSRHSHFSARLHVPPALFVADTEASFAAWCDIARQLAESFPARCVLLLSYRAIAGELLLLGGSAPPDSISQLRRPRLSLPTSSELVRRLRTARAVWFRVVDLPDGLEPLAAADPTMSHTLILPIINPADDHLLGVILATFRCPHFLTAIGGDAAIPRGQANLLEDIALLLERQREVNRTTIVLATCQEILAAGSLTAAAAAIQQRLSNTYSVKASLWLDASPLAPNEERPILLTAPATGDGDHIRFHLEVQGPLRFELDLVAPGNPDCQLDLSRIAFALRTSPLGPSLHLAWLRQRIDLLQQLLQNSANLAVDFSVPVARDVESLRRHFAATFSRLLGLAACHTLWLDFAIVLDRSQLPLELDDQAWAALLASRALPVPAFGQCHIFTSRNAPPKTLILVQPGLPVSVGSLVLIYHGGLPTFAYDLTEVRAAVSYASSMLQARLAARELEEHSATLRHLFDVSAQIRSGGELDSILRRAAEAALKLTASDLVTVQRPTPEDHEKLSIHAAACKEGDSDAHLGRLVRLGEGVTGLAAKRRESIRVPDVRLQPGYVEFRALTRSELVAPILDTNEKGLLGIINAESDALDHYSELDQELLEVLSIQTAIAIQSARRLGELEEAHERLQHSHSLAMIGLLYGDDIHLTANKLATAEGLARALRQHSDPRPVDVVARRIENHIRHVRDLTRRIRKTVSPGRPAMLSLSALVRDVIKAEAPPAGVKIVGPTWTGDDKVFGLKRQLQQVLRVIVKNALGALDGSGRLEFSLRAAERAGFEFFELSVVDSGPGIPRYLQKRIFTLRKQVEGRGFGLGLAWVRLFLSMYGGDITVQSQPGRTEFLIRIPSDVRMSADRLLLGET